VPALLVRHDARHGSARKDIGLYRAKPLSVGPFMARAGRSVWNSITPLFLCASQCRHPGRSEASIATTRPHSRSTSTECSTIVAGPGDLSTTSVCAHLTPMPPDRKDVVYRFHLDALRSVSVEISWTLNRLTCKHF
jgi:hypothetical protein